MNSLLGQAIRKVNTGRQWSTLSSVLGKINRILPSNEQISGHELLSFLQSIDTDELRLNGIWAHSFGSKYEPLILTNPAYSRAIQTGKHSCCCKLRSKESAGQYFGSTAYNAGRHCSTNSVHANNCPKWTPPSSGHLHSWRRTFED